MGLAKPNKSVTRIDMVKPEWLKRQKVKDDRGRVEVAVMTKWCEINTRKPSIDFGHVPLDSLCNTGGKNKRTHDPQQVAAVNSAIQWLFGTNVGRATAQELLEVETDLYKKKQDKRERERLRESDRDTYGAAAPRIRNMRPRRGEDKDGFAGRLYLKHLEIMSDQAGNPDLRFGPPFHKLDRPAQLGWISRAEKQGAR